MTETLSHPAQSGSVPQRVPRIGVSLRRLIVAVLLIVSVAGAATLVVGEFGSESVAPADEFTVGQAATGTGTAPSERRGGSTSTSAAATSGPRSTRTPAPATRTRMRPTL